MFCIGVNDFQYIGIVYIFFGIKEEGFNFYLSVVIYGNGIYYNFGIFLLGVDIDGDGFKDFIIGFFYVFEGGFQRGFVVVFLVKIYI